MARPWAAGDGLDAADLNEVNIGLQAVSLQTYAGNTAGDLVIAHGLGVVPKLVLIEAFWNVSGSLFQGSGVYDVVNNVMGSINTYPGGSPSVYATSSFVIDLQDSGAYHKITAAADGTNVTLTRTVAGGTSSANVVLKVVILA